MRKPERPQPEIPDHEVVRKIGGGSYGEVWLARAVTGAWRAVKVVWRADFSDDVSFEREFKGILQYEPVSRDHPGLVHILHVGRGDGDEGAFYYYVMELGDDVSSGTAVDKSTYEPRTLMTDLKRAGGKPLDVNDTMDAGLRLAEALQYLHSVGLAHRDVKPCNIIFVGGKAKLADIGLVAPRGQHTFVGTEGFVPPEGPGTGQADVYGLGKVLYEMATGRDRLQFPELPDELPDNFDRKRWLDLNQVICDICEPRVSKRTIKNAQELAEAIQRLIDGRKFRKKRRQTLSKVALVILVLSGVLFGVNYFNRLSSANNLSEVAPEVEPEKEPEFGSVKINSMPEGASVYDRKGRYLGVTPYGPVTEPAGEYAEYELRLEGHSTKRDGVMVAADKMNLVIPKLDIFSPPIEGIEWSDNMGSSYQPIGDYHRSSYYVSGNTWDRYQATLPKAVMHFKINHSESGSKNRIVLVQEGQAKLFCDWLTANNYRDGYLTDDEYMHAVVDKEFSSADYNQQHKRQKVYPFRVEVKKISYSQLVVSSSPTDAEVIMDGVWQGLTPLQFDRIRPDQMIKLEFRLEGYRRIVQKMKLHPGQEKTIHIQMQRNDSVIFGSEWQNSLGMKFVPMGDDLLVSAWETRVQDYAEFLKTQKNAKHTSPPFAQGPTHPVVNVSRDNARAFCRWLTNHDRRRELISNSDYYRLPTDYEWSLMAGLQEDVDLKPAERESRKNQSFPWGPVWPPEDVPYIKVGNLADISAAQALSVPRSRALSNYDDGFVYTAPVGSFPPNSLGIFDLSGNAQEWVDDDYSTSENGYGVLRGGHWRSYSKEHLYIKTRSVMKRDRKDDTYGFRVVLAKRAEPVDDKVDSKTDSKSR